MPKLWLLLLSLVVPDIPMMLGICMLGMARGGMSAALPEISPLGGDPGGGRGPRNAMDLHESYQITSSLAEPRLKKAQLEPKLRICPTSDEMA